MKLQSNLLFCILFLVNSFIAFCQKKADFLTTFHFTDKLGNIDSIKVGFDRAGTKQIDTVKSVFGELDISSKPFKKTFEVRAGEWRGPNSKIMVNKHEKCDTVERSMYTIFLRSRNFPVTMTWDNKLFQDSCMKASQFTRCIGILLYDFNEPTKRFLKDTNLLVIDREYMDGWKFGLVNFLAPMDDLTMDTVQLFYMVISKKRAGSTAVNDQILAGKVTLSPNPASTTVNLTIDAEVDMPNEWELLISDLTGQRVSKKKYFGQLKQTEMDVSGLPPGLYIIQIKSENKILFADKLVHF